MDAILALEDGLVFRGRRLGAAGRITGEVVFNTGMTGYQEILTDPSYRGQIVTLTVPHVGNTGVNEIDPESDAIQAAGFAVREASPLFSNWRSEGDLDHALARAGVVGIQGIDTRRLTRRLREGGVVRGCLDSTGAPPEEVVAEARRATPLERRDLVAEVTRARPAEWSEGPTELMPRPPVQAGSGYRVVVFDYGVKRNILRSLAGQGAGVTVVPARTSAADVLALRPDGVLLSNGPGDPAHYQALVETVGALIGRVPIFGICLGHQLVARALGARTFKLKFGHRGINHPVRELASGRVLVTSQNHGYAVDPDTLPPELEVTHVSLYDQTIEGLRHIDRPLFTVQFHPEAAPGPHDAYGLFRRFAEEIERFRPRRRAHPERRHSA